jgi:LuxR family maltose regulon positive regulatory protein
MRKFEQTIVGTKLMPPVSRRRQLISRRRLASVLLPGQAPRLTLVTAPAGYGKTSLLYQWHDAVRVNGDAAAWVSLDPQDSVPARFLRHVIAAIHGEHPGFGEFALRYLDSARDPDITAPLGRLVNEIQQIGHRVVLFLDDYHLIESSDVSAFLDYLLNLAPENFLLVVSSRLTPQLNLPALRLRDQLLEVDAKSLSFDKSETTSFLTAASDRNLSPAEIDLLHERSEGWVAGLQLAVAALKGHAGASELATIFTGRFRDIADYLAKAVLTRQTEEVQDFLLSTAILDRFNASVCEELTGNPRTQEIIERLERANLFVVPLDDQRVWYRYHHLFQEFLLGTLGRTRPAQVVPLYRRAAEWFFRSSLGVEAVEYALLSGDLDRASQMAESHALQRILAGYMPEIAHWLSALPQPLWQRNAALAGLHCLSLWHMFRQNEAAQFLEEFERSIENLTSEADAPLADKLRNDARLHSAGIAVCASRDPAEVLQKLDAIDVARLSQFYRGVYHNVRGIALGEQNHFGEALASYRAAAGIYRVIGSTLGLACSYYLEALMQLETGNLRAIDALLARVPEEPVFASPAARYIYPSMLDCVRGVLLYERGTYSEAYALLEANLDLAVEVGHLKMTGLVFVTFARLLLMQDRTTEAREQLERLSEHLRRNAPDSARALIVADYERIRYALLTGSAVAAQEIASAYGVNFAGDPPKLPVRWSRLECLAALVWCRARIALGLPQAALPVVRQLARLAQLAERKRRYLESRLLEALLLKSAGDAAAAIDVLRRTLMTCAEESLVSLVAAEGPAMAELVCQLQATKECIEIDPGYVARVRAAAARNWDPATPGIGSGPGTAALHLGGFSERERAVLRLVAIGNSNPAISKRLSISLHTVKWHLANLYVKLQVHNRTAAVGAARAIKLI